MRQRKRQEAGLGSRWHTINNLSGWATISAIISKIRLRVKGAKQLSSFSNPKPLMFLLETVSMAKVKNRFYPSICSKGWILLCHQNKVIYTWCEASWSSRPPLATTPVFKRFTKEMFFFSDSPKGHPPALSPKKRTLLVKRILTPVQSLKSNFFCTNSFIPFCKSIWTNQFSHGSCCEKKKTKPITCRLVGIVSKANVHLHPTAPLNAGRHWWHIVILRKLVATRTNSAHQEIPLTS